MKPRTSTSPIRRWRSLAVVAALLASVMTLTAPAAAQDDVLPPEIPSTGMLGAWTLYEDIVPRVYGFEGDGFAVISGDPLENVCAGDVPPPLLPMMVRQTRNGTWVQRLQPGAQTTTAYVYDTDLDVFAFFDAMCPLFGTEDFPQPFAVGEVRVRERSWNKAEPSFGFDQSPGRYMNGVRGDVFGPDGQRYRLRASVTYDFNADGSVEFFADRLTVQPLSRP